VLNNHLCVIQIKLVRKDDIAGLYDTSWDLFVQGSSARKKDREMEEKQKTKLLHEQIRKRAKSEKEESNSFAKRLAKYAGPSAVLGNHFRITAAGTAMGILMGTPTFLKVQERDENETKKVLSVLERGSSASKSRSSNTLSSFQEVLIIEKEDLNLYVSIC